MGQYPLVFWPIDSVGLRMDDDSVRIAVGLRLGVPVCSAHKCYHCGADEAWSKL